VPNIKSWKSNRVTITPNQVNTYNTTKENTNIFQIINRLAAGGGSVFVDTEPTVSAQSYLVKVDGGSSQNLVVPYQVNTIYIYTESPSPLVLTINEIESEELSFVFGTAQLVNVSGNVNVQQPVTIAGTTSISGEVEVKNDSGNPLPISGNVGITGTPTVNIGTIPEVEIKNDTGSPIPVTQSLYGTRKVTASGDTLVKTGSGRIIGIKSDGTTVATIKDGSTELWSTTGESQFSHPLGYSTNLTVNLSAAGTVYIIYI
jgi:hypothetical protein